MIRIKLLFKNQHKRLSISSGIFAILLVLIISTSISAKVASQSETTLSYLPLSAGRHFYLTDSSYYADQALTACSAGYHMASLWEILDVSNLTYDYDHPAAHTKDDSGFGPPSNWYGWVRTGYSSSSSSTTGTGNCNNWTSRLNTAYGVSVRLSNAWETAPGDISTWDATSFTCVVVSPVWCIGDFHQIYLPLIQR
jgi:hypothetical protein